MLFVLAVVSSVSAFAVSMCSILYMEQRSARYPRPGAGEKAIGKTMQLQYVMKGPSVIKRGGKVFCDTAFTAKSEKQSKN